MKRSGATKHYGPPAPFSERVRAAVHVMRGKPCMIGVTFKRADIHEDSKDLLVAHCAFRPDREAS